MKFGVCMPSPPMNFALIPSSDICFTIGPACGSMPPNNDQIRVVALDLGQDRLEVGVLVGRVLARDDLGAARLRRLPQTRRRGPGRRRAVVDHGDASSLSALPSEKRAIVGPC